MKTYYSAFSSTCSHLFPTTSFLDKAFYLHWKDGQFRPPFCFYKTFIKSFSIRLAKANRLLPFIFKININCSKLNLIKIFNFYNFSFPRVSCSMIVPGTNSLWFFKPFLTFLVSLSLPSSFLNKLPLVISTFEIWKV